MGFFNKVKNIFFEEEIVEVEEKPKKVQKEVPVAKKIELPKVEKIEKNEEFDSTEEQTKETDIMPTRERRFPMHFDENDFKEETDVVNEEDFQEDVGQRRSERHTTLSSEEDVKEDKPIKEEKQEKAVLEKAPKFDFEVEYGREKEVEKPNLYEGKGTKKVFTPTPIISPIYGILDKNYKKDDVVTKKEIRLSSAPKKIDLDSVREKAYGDLTSDISQSMEEVTKKEASVDDSIDLVEDDNLLYDLNDNSSPAVKKVTVGDAEEYFNELGLEYNIDYKDTSVEKSKAPKEKNRRIEKEETPVVEEDEDEKEENANDDEIESNLFDLIESMYEEKE